MTCKFTCLWLRIQSVPLILYLHVLMMSNHGSPNFLFLNTDKTKVIVFGPQNIGHTHTYKCAHLHTHLLMICVCAQVSDLALVLISGRSGALIGRPVNFNLTAQGKLIGPLLHETQTGAYYVLFGLGECVFIYVCV